MKNTLFYKILAGSVVITVSLILVISVLSYRVIKSHYLNTLSSHLNDLALILMNPVQPLVIAQEYAQINDYINTVGQKTKFRITVMIPEGTVVADSEEDAAILDNHGDRPEVISALQGITGESVRFSRSVLNEMLYKAYPIRSNEGAIIGVLRISVFLDDINLLTNFLRREIFQTGLIVLLFSFVAIYLFSLRLTKPIRELTRASRNVAAGNFEVKVLNSSNDDLGSLCRAFNDMTGKINGLIAEITYQKDALNTIITTMKEGLILISQDGKVISANKSFLKISGFSEVSGKYYWEIVKQTELHHFITVLLESGKDSTVEVLLKNKVFYCSGIQTANREFLILLHDISAIKNSEQLKKDIVANVSHELRSPLTSIKGFIETLENEVSPNGRDFLAIVKRNTDRLINIVNDLLTLSKLESRNKTEFTTVNIGNVLNNLSRVYQEKATEKNLGLKVDIPQHIPPVSADEFQLEQMFSNLIENAIQHTEAGYVRISADFDNKFININIEDNGSGIAPEHHKRIFERFYVVDKSRSRKYGGTGLGLAIVKHIALLHNGEISLVSSLGKGSVFTVKLPLITDKT